MGSDRARRLCLEHSDVAIAWHAFDVACFTEDSMTSLLLNMTNMARTVVLIYYSKARVAAEFALRQPPHALNTRPLVRIFFAEGTYQVDVTGVTAGREYVPLLNPSMDDISSILHKKMHLLGHKHVSTCSLLSLVTQKEDKAIKQWASLVDVSVFEQCAVEPQHVNDFINNPVAARELADARAAARWNRALDEFQIEDTDRV